MSNLSLRERVIAFHERFGHPIGPQAFVPSDEVMRFRAGLITEEYLELMGAIFQTGRADIQRIGTSIAEGLAALIKEAPISVDFPELIDATFDLDFVVEGTRVVCGVDGDPGALAVYEANMQKEPNGPDKKPVKPLGWKAPDIAGFLLDQGWRPKDRCHACGRPNPYKLKIDGSMYPCCEGSPACEEMLRSHYRMMAYLPAAPLAFAPKQSVCIINGVSRGEAGTIISTDGVSTRGVRMWLVDIPRLRQRSIREDYLAPFPGT